MMVLTSSEGSVPVTIEYRATHHVSAVGIRGCWDHWSQTTPLTCISEKHDVWHVVLHLQPGIIAFRFICDSHWVTSTSYDMTDNGFGDYNNTLFVERPKQIEPPPPQQQHEELRSSDKTEKDNEEEQDFANTDADASIDDNAPRTEKEKASADSKKALTTKDATANRQNGCNNEKVISDDRKRDGNEQEQDSADNVADASVANVEPRAEDEMASADSKKELATKDATVNRQDGCKNENDKSSDRQGGELEEMRTLTSISTISESEESNDTTDSRKTRQLERGMKLKNSDEQVEDSTEKISKATNIFTVEKGQGCRLC